MSKTGTPDLMKCASKIHFRARRVRYHHEDKYWVIADKKVTLLTVYTMFLEKYPFVFLRDQAILIGAWGRCKCKLPYEEK